MRKWANRPALYTKMYAKLLVLSSSVKVFRVNNPTDFALSFELENAPSRNCFIASVPFTDISAILNVSCINTRKKRFVSLRYAMLISERKFYEIGIGYILLATFVAELKIQISNPADRNWIRRKIVSYYWFNSLKDVHKMNNNAVDNFLTIKVIRMKRLYRK